LAICFFVCFFVCFFSFSAASFRLLELLLLLFELRLRRDDRLAESSA
jgi:hypothetical protein